MNYKSILLLVIVMLLSISLAIATAGPLSGDKIESHNETVPTEQNDETQSQGLIFEVTTADRVMRSVQLYGLVEATNVTIWYHNNDTFIESAVVGADKIAYFSNFTLGNGLSYCIEAQSDGGAAYKRWYKSDASHPYTGTFINFTTWSSASCVNENTARISNIMNITTGIIIAVAPVITQINHTSDDATGTTCVGLAECAVTKAWNPSFDIILDVAGRVRGSTENQSYDDMPWDCTGNDTISLSCTFPTNVSIGFNQTVYFATLLTSDATANSTAPLDTANKASITIVRTMVGWVNDFLHQALSGFRVFIHQQQANLTEYIYGNATSDGSGDWEFNITDSGNYSVWSYDPVNSSRDGDLDNWYEIDDGT